MKNKTIKGITLTMFLTLIISFVAYRSGYFGGLRSTYSISPNGGALNTQTDTIPKIDSLKWLEMMSSSKVLILKDHPFRINDTSLMKIDSNFKVDPLIYSTKSGIILKPEDLKKHRIDSTKIDSLKK